VPEQDRNSPIEGRIERSFEDTQEFGKPLSKRARQRRRTVEAYLRAGVMPRYMERLRQIERETETQRSRLELAYHALQAECAGDPELFAELWRRRAGSWRGFERLNDLIAEHNEWYPIEASLAMDPRTRDYVRIRGRSYRRERLDANWVLSQFPPQLPDQS
jgi:hypothetical protein